MKTPLPATIDDQAADWVYRRDEGLAEDEEARFQAWCAADLRHRAAVERVDRAMHRVRRLRSTGEADVLVRALDRRARQRRRRTVAAAAAMIGALALVCFWPRPARLPSGPERGVAFVRPRTQTLPDGSIAELKGDTRIAVDFQARERRVVLRTGEAHFQVVKDAARPFVVRAAGLDFRAVGTAFSVEVGAERVVLVVTEGRVAADASQGEGDSAGESYGVVAAGQILVVQPQSRFSPPVPATLTAAAIADKLAWRAPRLEFTGTPLAQALTLLNAHSEVRLVIDDPSLAAMPVSGLFRADRAEAFARMLELNFSVQAERVGNEIHLRPAPAGGASSPR